MTDYDKNSWSTPDYVYKALACEFDFVLDAAASDSNHKCAKYLTKEQNALQTDWRQYVGKRKHNNEAVWINPPYDNIGPWITKASEESAFNYFNVVMLVPATPDVGWWPEYADEIRFITKGRISFVHPDTGKPINGNTKGSALLIFRAFGNPFAPVTRYITRGSLKLTTENNLVNEVSHG